jgi:cell division protein FtsL
VLRFLAFGSIALMFVSAFALYSIDNETRKLAEEVDAKRRLKQKLINSIAVLKAERAYRSRPSAIEPLARQLGMRPTRGEQVAGPEALFGASRRPQ